MKNLDEGWLAVSTDGFAQQNAARPPEHLVKELVQNSLDALPEEGGTISLWTEPAEDNTHMWVHCEDSGCGIEDMENLRTVFWTSKQDSHLKRGRMGRGFKEMLCLCSHAEVTSNFLTAAFATTPKGKRLFSIQKNEEETKGSKVSMRMPWDYEIITTKLKMYFEGFLPPKGVTLLINKEEIVPQKPKHTLDAVLTTESFQNGRWVKPSTKTKVELIPSGEAPGLIYEMGIPVCPAEWEVPYHANICQRVPMNPNRDAVMSGFAGKIHRACLPTLLKELDEETARASWVGEAAAKSRDDSLQKEVLQRAFGENLARSVPKFGKFDHDADAEEKTGAKILDTRQLSGGFRELAKTHVPTSMAVATAAREKTAKEAASRGTNPEDASEKWMQRYGKAKVKTVCAFHKWLADQILERIFPNQGKSCAVRVADMEGIAEATWTDQFQILTFALDLPRIWETPLDQENFALVVHETAHELAAHHGKSFAQAMESTAGAALTALFENDTEIKTWKKKLES